MSSAKNPKPRTAAAQTAKPRTLKKSAKAAKPEVRPKITGRFARFRAWQKPWAMLFIVSFLLAMVFPLSAYIKPAFGAGMNADGTSPRDLVLPVYIALATALIVSLIYRYVFKRTARKSLLASIILVLFCSGFNERFYYVLPFLRAFVPLRFGENWPYTIFFFIILAAISALAAMLIVRLFDKWTVVGHQLNTVLIVAVVFMFIVNLFPAVVYLEQTSAQAAYRPPAISSQPPAGAASRDKPDIYYIVLDRYTNNDVLKSQLGYDNSPFLDSLRQEGFYVKDDAYASYPYTAMSVGATMKSDFIGDMEKQFGKAEHQTHTGLFNLTKYSPIAAELKKIGYKYDEIGTWYGVSNKAPLADTFAFNFARLTGVGGIKDLAEYDSEQLNNSPYFEMLKAGVKLPGMSTPLVKYNTQTATEMTQYELKTLKDMAGSTTPGGRFIFAHILLPHDPYVFNADGSVGGFDDGNNNKGKLLFKKYTDQIEFVNSQVKQLVSTIKQRTGGKAAIVLQADEGFYPQWFLEDHYDYTKVEEEINTSDMRDWSDAYLRAKYGVLAAYYLPGIPQSELAKNVTSTNIFRIILNQYFGYQLPYLPDCHFGFDKGRADALSYTDLTLRFHPQEAPMCKSVHD